jgi:cytochrome c553
MIVKFVTALSLAAVLGWSGAALGAGTAEAGQTKAATCSACHGMDGNSVNPEWPSLASQHASYITRQLKSLRGGQRQNPLMSPMATTLTDQDIDDVAAYFSSQALRATGEADPSKLALGQKIYRAGDVSGKVPACAGCHGPTGSGNPAAVYPRIGGQHATYVALQLRAYKTGTRATDPNGMMRSVAGQLSESEIDAVASYIQGLR